MSGAEQLPERKILALSLASVWGWLAHTAADDAMDENRAENVPVALWAAREAFIVYSRAAGPASRIVTEIMTRMDAANLWELLYCKIGGPAPVFDDMSFLAERSLGHALGPLLITAWCGYGKSSSEFKACMDFFVCYLAARQLNDDAHDWVDDLGCGRLNAASARLFMQHPSYPPDLRVLQEEFWQHAILEIAQAIQALASRARAALDILPLRDKSRMVSLLAPLQEAAARAAQESRKTMRFLAAYRG